MKSCHVKMDNSAVRQRARKKAVRPCIALGCMLAVLVGISGCGSSSDVELAYGSRRGRGARSIDGTSVLATMFELRGFKVYSWDRLSPKLNQYQVIVWTPDDFGLPGDRPRRFFDQWLARGSDRTVIYVGRDYDTATRFWHAMEGLVPPDGKIDALRQAALARARHATRRLRIPKDEACPWFAMRRAAPYRRATTLQGPLAAGLAPKQADIWFQSVPRVPTTKQLNKLWGTMPPAPPEEPKYEVLLASGTTPLVIRITKINWYNGQVLVVANGSFLLNYPLVNKQHRELAGKLIDLCGADNAGTKVAFLTNGPGGPAVYAREPDQVPDSVRRERVIMALHWLVLGLAVCFSLYPIFGRPRTPPSESLTDFGQHIDALAGLLQRTNDESFARREIGHYRAVAHRESGATHLQTSVQAPRPDRVTTPATGPDGPAAGHHETDAEGRSSAPPENQT